jgi:S1-C subfamily serine protease
VDAQVLTPAGQPDLQTALSTENQKLKVVKTAPDQMENQEYQDPDSSESASLSLHASGQNDIAVLQLTGKEFVPLALAEAGTKPGSGMKTTLYSFPFGLNQKQAKPRPLEVKADAGGQLITLDRQLNPGESGAPLLTSEGKVLGLASGKNECIPIDLVRSQIN